MNDLLKEIENIELTDKQTTNYNRMFVFCTTMIMCNYDSASKHSPIIPQHLKTGYELAKKYKQIIEDEEPYSLKNISDDYDMVLQHRNTSRNNLMLVYSFRKLIESR